MRPRPLCLVMLLFAAALVALPVRAGEENADYKLFSALRTRLEATAKEKPLEAIAEYRRFVEQNQELNPWVAVLACSTIADLYRNGAGDAKTSYEILDWALGKYGEHQAAAGLVAEKAKALLAEKRFDEAAAAVEAGWPKLVAGRSYHANSAVYAYYSALDQQGKREKAADLLARALFEIPALLDDSQQNQPGWVYDRLVRLSIALNRPDEAVGWAKVEFITCPFEDAAVQRATQTLARAWLAKDPSQATANAFVDAQGDAKVKNPLAEVKCPAPDAGNREEYLQRLRGGWRERHARISYLIFAGMPRQAMLAAQQETPQVPNRVNEICRVLKAFDGHTRRANAFLEYMRKGGMNPVDEFLGEHPEEAR